MLFQVTLDFTQAAEENLAGSSRTFGGWVSQILAGIFAISAILVLLNLVWGGISWITAGGDAAKVQKARDRIIQSIIGLVVLASALAIFSFVQGFLGIDVLTFN